MNPGASNASPHAPENSAVVSGFSEGKTQAPITDILPAEDMLKVAARYVYECRDDRSCNAPIETQLVKASKAIAILLAFVDQETTRRNV